MNKELELWQFIAERLRRNESVMLLVVAESSGSSPGRQGYKMAVGADGKLIGSIGGGVMEVNLVEECRAFLRDTVTGGRGDTEISRVSQQVHQENSSNASGMICSGKQTVIFKLLTSQDAGTVDSIVDALKRRIQERLKITPEDFRLTAEQNPPATAGGTDFVATATAFTYIETVGFKDDLYIIGGGHCALALSELMSKMDFHISLFDDRPELNTIEKNRFAHEIRIVGSYAEVGRGVLPGDRSYVVVMTLGYKSDEAVIRALIDNDFKYFGVLGSNAKMSVMLRKLSKEGLPAEKLDRIRTPIGIPIHSRTPEEIAISIAAEIIAVKNA